MSTQAKLSEKNKLSIHELERKIEKTDSNEPKDNSPENALNNIENLLENLALMFEAIIFDWDGTLADTHKAIVYSFHKTLGEIGADVADEQITRRIGIGATEIFREILSSRNKSFDSQLIAELVARKINAEISVSNEVELFEGALELLKSLKGKMKLGLASMNNRQVIDNLLFANKINDFFSVTLTVEEVLEPKPNPQIFLKTAEKLQTAPKRCVVVEDSVFGVRAAKSAGMACVGVAQGAFSNDELARAHADFVVSSIREKGAIESFILR
jgi:HAD superfamily hydrolase (TIGR01509 family)